MDALQRQIVSRNLLHIHVEIENHFGRTLHCWIGLPQPLPEQGLVRTRDYSNFTPRQSVVEITSHETRQRFGSSGNF